MSTPRRDADGSAPDSADTATADRSSPDWRWRDVAGVSVMALANFAAAGLMLVHLVSRFQHDHQDANGSVTFLLSSDLATPLAVWVWFLMLVNGLVLCAPPRTRVVGLGLVMASGVIAVPVLTWAIWAMTTYTFG